MYNNCDDPDILAEVERCIERARTTQNNPLDYEYGEVVDSDESDGHDCADEDELPGQGVYLGSLAPAVSRAYLIGYLRAYRSLC